jgi:Zn-dependent metalloprotease
MAAAAIAAGLALAPPGGHAAAGRETPQPACANLADAPLPADAVAHRDPGNGTIVQLEGADLSSSLEKLPAFRALRAKNETAGIALCFLQAYGKLFKLEAPFQEFRLVVESPDETGSTHVKLRQYYANLPVREGRITVHINPGKQVYQVEGRYYPTPSGLPTKPRLSAERATEAAREALAPDPSGKREFRTQAAIYVGAGNRARLAYRVEAYQGAEAWEFWIDANTGAVLEKNPAPTSRN